MTNTKDTATTTNVAADTATNVAIDLDNIGSTLAAIKRRLAKIHAGKLSLETLNLLREIDQSAQTIREDTADIRAITMQHLHATGQENQTTLAKFLNISPQAVSKAMKLKKTALADDNAGAEAGN